MITWKINTALILCTTIVFRLAFFHVFNNSSLSQHRLHQPIKTSFLAAQVKKLEFEVAGNLERVEHSIAEICEEENAHERYGLESNPSLIQLIYSPLADLASIKLNGILPTDHHHSHFSSCRYLTLQVLRT
jgi:hypothetical protein